MSAAIFSFYLSAMDMTWTSRVMKNVLHRFGDSLLSVSRRTISGSRRPARENSSSMAGSVAEISMDWRFPGSFRQISFSCAEKPSSNS